MLRSAQIIRTALKGLRVSHAAIATNKVIARNSSITTWNKDWKPGPYPRTEEERIAAAKKYNMIPEDYQPYPEEEGFGDYPMFEKFHMETKDPFEFYDFPVLKRNYCEPVHPDFDLCLEDKSNFQAKLPHPLWKIYLYLFLGMGSFMSLCYLIYLPGGISKTVPKQYPNTGVVHYTFEAAE